MSVLDLCYGSIAWSVLASISMKAVNREKQLAWLCPPINMLYLVTEMCTNINVKATCFGFRGSEQHMTSWSFVVASGLPGNQRRYMH